METKKKFEVLGKVIERLESEIHNCQEWRGYSVNEMNNCKQELMESYSGEELEEAIEGSYRIRNAKDEIDRYNLEEAIYNHLKKYLYDNFQKIIK